MSKYVYFFGSGKTEGAKAMRELLGGKGANLAEMTKLDIDVPPGFTISTEACRYYYEKDHRFPSGLEDEIKENLMKLEESLSLRFGAPEDPLLVSVRSGAMVSMPGMMDTILNIGLTDESVKGLSRKTGNERFAYDCYRRFIQMFGDVVLGVNRDMFEEILDGMKRERGAEYDTQLTDTDLKEVVAQYKKHVEEQKGESFPADPYEQLRRAVVAVFESWQTPRAVEYRRLHRIPDTLGTAVNVQVMVFGNTGENSGTGVAFTRNPATGDKAIYGEYLLNAQGEDVVAGIRTPRPLMELKNDMPEIFGELIRIFERLERHYRDMQDVEFTVQDGKLWMLQTRTGKRTAQAAIRIAVDMLEEGLIDRKTAVTRVEPSQLDQLLHKTFDPGAEKKIIAKGLNASPGAATGRVIFNTEDALSMHEHREPVILVRQETSPDDVAGMAVSEGILTSKGGMTSHAAVVARGMGKCCVAGCGSIQVDYDAEQFRVGELSVKKGDYISLDGTSGEVMLGEVPSIESEITRVISGEMKAEHSRIYAHYEKLMSWADGIRRLGVRTNADNPEDAALARNFGAEGIGLARTEHMFFGERLPEVRKLIIAEDERERRKAIEKLLPMQKEDFKGIFRAMDGLPVIVRLLDPPLHEFLPKLEEIEAEVTRAQEKGEKSRVDELQEMQVKTERLKESNPMLGHRGCRVGITFPDIYEMQVRAICEAACELKKEGLNPIPEIMIPVVSHVNELAEIKAYTRKRAEEVMNEQGVKVDYLFGTMIELPRAALTADEIAKEVDFFSYGTNDLTQTTYGFSRDDIEEKFLPVYIDKRILVDNPFAVLDPRGVGELVKIGKEKGRASKPSLEVGICGEHGGEPKSIEFCHRIGLDYVSCSPYRVPIARLAAAHAVLEEECAENE
jgi:pyruvate,orthophosphate dikinase